MSETAQVIQAATMRELVKPLGIEVPFEFNDYEEQDEQEVFEAFGTEVDRLLGRGRPEGVEGQISAEGISLTIGSVLKPCQYPGESPDFDDMSFSSETEDSTTGPKRWLTLRAPLRFSGVGIDEEVRSGLHLEASETWRGLFKTKPVDPKKVDIDMAVSTLWVPLPANPTEAAFGLEPSTAFTDESVLSRGNDYSNEVWELHTKAESKDERYQTSDYHKRAFEIGTEILKSMDPSMLELSSL